MSSRRFDMKNGRNVVALWLLGTLGLLAGGWAQTPLGPQFRVDLGTEVIYPRYSPGVAFAPDGTLWIAWENSTLSGPRYGIAARSFPPSGGPSRFLLPLPGPVQIPLLVPSPGGFAVLGQDQNAQFLLRRFSAAGKLRGHEVFVQQAGPLSAYVATALPGGGLILVWTADDCPGRCGSPGVFARMLDALGRPQTPAFRVNQTIRGQQIPTGVVADPDGNVFVTWYSPVAAPLETAVFARRFSRQGKPLGDELRISVQTPGGEGGAAADAQGNFVVTWATRTLTPKTAIYARRYSRLGEPLGPELPVSQESSGADVFPQVAMSPQGDFFVAWESFDCARCDYVDVKGRLFRADGTAEDEILVNGYRKGIQADPSVAFGPDGRIAVVWLGESDQHYEYEVDARLFSSR